MMMTMMILPITTSGLFSLKSNRLIKVKVKVNDVWLAMPVTCSTSRTCIATIEWIDRK